MNKVWGSSEKSQWLSEQAIQRSYNDDVVSTLKQIDAAFELICYGKLNHDPSRYPLYLLKSANWSDSKLNILITGGVHGYETSGVLGALSFAKQHAAEYLNDFNFIIAPCVSPWAYETINRWNPLAIDPNRSFYLNSPAEESSLLMKAIKDLDITFTAHIDLHETTDTDNSVFRPALAARDATPQPHWNIPDGFYTVGDSDNPVDDFQHAIIQSVKKVTHIALADSAGKLIGEPTTQAGVINYPLKKLALCASLTGCQYTTTTEVYPDSDRSTPTECIAAQVAAIKGALGFLRKLN